VTLLVFKDQTEYRITVQKGEDFRKVLFYILHTFAPPFFIHIFMVVLRMRTALYLRVSTAQQKPDLQTDGLRQYAARAGLKIVAEPLGIAVSGRKEGRAGSPKS
jgi:hypothetical protein